MRVILCLAFSVAFGAVASAVTFFNSTGFANNGTVRTNWLAAIGVSNGQFFEGFESIANATNVHNNGSFFSGGLRILSATGTAKVTSSTSDLGGSNPIGTKALALSEGSGLRATLEFDGGYATYAAGYDIDQSTATIRVVLEDTTFQEYVLDSTASGGNSAEFWGVVAGAGEKIDRVEFRTVGGSAGWGLDSLEYNQIPVPEPASMAVMAVGLLAVIKRKAN
jgi:hypothetical protein